MSAVLNFLSNFMSAFGASVFVPIVLFIIAKIMKVPNKKAFNSALNAGIGLTGFSLIINSFLPIITPVVNRMIETTGLQMDILDIGWQATSVVAYSTTTGTIYLALGLIIQTVLFAIKWTDVFMPSDMWNNYSFMLWGSMLYVVTGSMPLAIGLMVLSNLYSLLCAETMEKRWSTYYGYPGCTITAPHNVGALPIALITNWIFNKLGLSRINWSPDSIKKKIGFLGEPTTLGLLIGMILGIAGNLTRLTTMEAWGEIFNTGIATAAVMAIFPKVSGIFASAFTSITDASKKSLKGTGKERQFYLAINDAAGYGEPATLMTAILLIPITVILAFILPWNQVIPMVDLISIAYSLEIFICVYNGNMFKGLIGGTIWVAILLTTCTLAAPIFTEVAIGAGVAIPEGATMVCSLAVMTGTPLAILFFVFLTRNPIAIAASVVVYFALYFLFKKNKDAIQAYIERTAVGTSATAE